MRPQRFPVAGAVCLALLLTAGPVRAGTDNVSDADCSQLKLGAASGVPDDDRHVYQFRGTCDVFVTNKHGKHSQETVWAEVDVVWDQSEALLREKMRVTNPKGLERYEGAVSTELKCGADPVIYSSSCVLVAHANDTNWSGFSRAATLQKRPITQGKTTLEEAATFSAKSAKNVPPPPPPPAPSPKKRPQLQQAPTPSKKTFSAPEMDGYLIDFCFFWGEKCGQDAATAFCVEQGYAGALEWEVGKGLGSRKPTRTLGDKRVCDRPDCDGFASITCSK